MSNSEEGGDDSDPSDLGQEENEQPDKSDDNESGLGEEWFETGDPYSVQSLQVQPIDRNARRATGRRATTVSDSSVGRYTSSRIPQGKASDLAIDATLRQQHHIKKGANPRLLARTIQKIFS
ncbi:MAG: hypothetical protein CM1200mP35_03510 [Chloroflexota bacterium]|nr:MAG: hypothetical protein CM1200mP35_03510 [Chloroflexota bacterium]